MLTLLQLINRLTDQITASPEAADALVVFGEDYTPVAGGILRQVGDDGLALNLAPISLDQVGGF